MNVLESMWQANLVYFLANASMEHALHAHQLCGVLQHHPAAQVAPEMQPVIVSLRGLVQACATGLAGVPAKKREMEDNSKRVGGLFWRLNARTVSTEPA